jgi:L-ascorbate metabolism protein UlaG (beta-lactamase superfamily)
MYKVPLRMRRATWPRRHDDAGRPAAGAAAAHEQGRHRGSRSAGIKVTAVRAEHSSVYVWRNPATGKNETHPGGEAVGWIIELENGFRIYHAGDTAVFGDMKPG